jgi:hypothetical protein
MDARRAIRVLGLVPVLGAAVVLSACGQGDQ